MKTGNNGIVRFAFLRRHELIKKKETHKEHSAEYKNECKCVNNAFKHKNHLVSSYEKGDFCDRKIRDFLIQTQKAFFALELTAPDEADPDNF